jgi:hypothetical protein
MLWAPILFIVYLLLLLLFLNKNRFIKNSGLSARLISLLFILKVLAGIFFTWYNIEYTGDLVNTYRNSLEETTLLKQKPVEFFTSLFKSGYGDYEGFYSSHSYWNDLRFIFLDKLMAVLNLFSFKNIYINTLIYDAVIFFAHISLFRTFSGLWPQKKWAIITGCFLIPGSLFFLSGINKDSLIFLGISMVISALYTMPFFKKNYVRAKPVLLLTGGLLIMFVFRNFFFAAVVPAILSYYIATALKIKPWVVFLSVFLLLITVIVSCKSVLTVICQKQTDFLQLGIANSNVQVNVLQPTAKSFALHLPVALNIVFLRPYAWHSYNMYYFFCGLEMLLINSLIIYALYTIIKTRREILNNPLILFCIFFSFTALLIIGYTVPVIGAVVRYRSGFLPLLLTPLLCSIQWQKLTAGLNKIFKVPLL